MKNRVTQVPAPEPAVVKQRTATPKARAPRKAKKGALVVETAGLRHYISVPTGRAIDLHNYLRSHHVLSAYPEPAYTGMDSIELAKGIDVDAVQALLHAWK
jgi:hypothetical protein